MERIGGSDGWKGKSMADEMRGGLARRLTSALPLFRKELLEQAARPRTYGVRVGYASILVAVFLLCFFPLTRQFGNSPESILGLGKEFLEFMAYTMFVVTYLVVPPLVASAFPVERQRGSLALLWLTGLRPTEILAEKFLGRVFPALTLLLTSLPILTISYAFGGFTTDRLFNTYYWLLLTCFQLGSLALFFSTALKSTMRAILLTYLVAFFLNCILPFLEYMVDIEPFTLSPIGKYAETQMARPAEAAIESLPIVISALVFLVLGRLILTREFSPRTSPLQRTEMGIKLEARVGRTLRWFKTLKGLPDHEPVAWRARGGGFRERFARTLWMLFVLECVLVLILLGAYGEDFLQWIIVPVVFNWFMIVLVITLRGVNLVIQERTRQTLTVLLVTPLTGREILLQKWKGLRRTALLSGLLLLPLFGLHALHLIDQARGTTRGWYSDPLDPGAYLTASILSVVVYLPLLGFFSLWIGLRARTTVRASLTALFVVFLACVLPLFVLPMFGFKPSYAWMLSPAMSVLLFESGLRVSHIEPWAWIGLNFTLYGTLLVVFRTLYLRGASRHLGRVE
jgi:ABC-type transport system involved in multi-copper enzyme maturation permease subunit